MSDSFFQIEYRPGEEVVLRFKSPKFQGLPDSTQQHLSTAGKEILLALRSLLDGAIEKAERSGEPERKKRTKIEVQ